MTILRKLLALAAIIWLSIWYYEGMKNKQFPAPATTAAPVDSPATDGGFTSPNLDPVDDQTENVKAGSVGLANKADSESSPAPPARVREEDFIAKYRNMDVAALVKQKPLREFPDDFGGTLFVVHESGVIATNDKSEIQFRRYLETGPGTTMGVESCVSIQLPNKKIIVGSREDGSLLVRAGPVAHSFLISIAEKYFFLIYSDMILWEEIKDNPRPTGVLLYFVRQKDGSIRPAGQWARWTRADEPMVLTGMNYCRNSFSDADLRE